MEFLRNIFLRLFLPTIKLQERHLEIYYHLLETLYAGTLCFDNELTLYDILTSPIGITIRFIMELKYAANSCLINGARLVSPDSNSNLRQ